MKHVIHSVLHFGLALLLGLSSVISPLAMSSAEANSCYDIFAGTTSKRGYREVRLEPGDQVWGYYSCKSCSAQVSAKPNKYKRQECPNCGTAHSNEAYARPETIEHNG
ncbi:MAG: hypothetical protein JNJ49_09505, partial [Bdellovibrionaceae bacterium]|nr:hypothetical protein [Pseudobdellovibrionaceae bacterium]